MRRPPTEWAREIPGSSDQPRVNGWYLSWNPDDERYYVCAEDNGVATATFAEWRNAVYYARTHTCPPPEVVVPEVSP